MMDLLERETDRQTDTDRQTETERQTHRQRETDLPSVCLLGESVLDRKGEKG